MDTYPAVWDFEDEEPIERIKVFALDYEKSKPSYVPDPNFYPHSGDYILLTHKVPEKYRGAINVIVEYATTLFTEIWGNRPAEDWFFAMLEEMGELGETLLGNHEGPIEHELAQIGAFALNWLVHMPEIKGDMEFITIGGDFEEEDEESKSEG